MTDEIRAYWNTVSDSEWYRSLRTEEKIGALLREPESAFRPEVTELLRKYVPELRGRAVLLPSSGDNHAAFALSRLGARVTSADISERQLENAEAIAKAHALPIDFVREDTMKLSSLPDEAFDLIYTSNGTLSWIWDLNAMYAAFARVLKKGGLLLQYDIHPFTRPFSCEAFREPKIVKPYHEPLPDLHWRMEDLLNAQARAGFALRELRELPANDASFWYTYRELQEKSPEDLSGINDWTRNPMAALPAWAVFAAEKR